MVMDWQKHWRLGLLKSKRLDFEKPKDLKKLKLRGSVKPKGLPKLKPKYFLKYLLKYWHSDSEMPMGLKKYWQI